MIRSECPRNDRDDGWATRSARHLGLHHGLRDPRLCRARWFSTSVSACCLPTEHDEHDRDVMVNTIAPVWDGNETWLVLGGSGLYARLPDGLQRDPAGDLPAGHRDADGSDLPRRRLRIPLPRHSVPAPLVGLGFPRRIGGGCLLPGRHSRRADPGHQGRQQPVRRRSARLADALHRFLRRRRRLRLRPARRELAAVAGPSASCTSICGGIPSF